VGIGVMEKGCPSREQFFFFFPERTVELCEKWKRQPFRAPIIFFLIRRKFEMKTGKRTLFGEVGSEDGPIFLLVQSVFPVLFQQDQGE
jgi:hypothetical protein